MSLPNVEVETKADPVAMKVEERLAKEMFFTDLNTTATCLICGQKVLFREFNMKKHYIAKHAGEYNKYNRKVRKGVFDQLHADFNRPKGIPAFEEKLKPRQRPTGTLFNNIQSSLR